MVINCNVPWPLIHSQSWHIYYNLISVWYLYNSVNTRSSALQWLQLVLYKQCTGYGTIMSLFYDHNSVFLKQCI